MRVLIDTNVILDVWLAREPFLRESAILLSAAERGNFAGIISPTTVTTLHYLVKKGCGDKKARTLIKKLLEICEVGVLRKQEIEMSLESKIGDFEDAVLESVATASHVDVIATRNISDFKNSRVVALEPHHIKW